MPENTPEPTLREILNFVEKFRGSNAHIPSNLNPQGTPEHMPQAPSLNKYYIVHNNTELSSFNLNSIDSSLSSISAYALV